MKVKVIFTGGTIGSRTNGEYIGLAGAPYALLEGYGGDICFETLEPYSILSEELDSAHLLELAGCVHGALSGADAVIVTHGTDTLAYTSAFLGYVFSQTKIPIILVSSGYPLDDARANGRQNFAAALNLARHGIGGVFAVWHSGGEARIHIGTRLLAHMAYSDMLFSVGESFVPSSGEDDLRKNDSLYAAELFAKAVFADRLSGFGRVLQLGCRPDMFYPRLDDSVAAVILESYHSGTLCADERFREFVQSASEQDIQIFIAGAGNRDSDYESVKKYRDMGVLTLPVCSPAAAYVKLSLAASLGADPKKIYDLCCGADIIF